jgi:hypothetical protein
VTFRHKSNAIIECLIRQQELGTTAICRIMPSHFRCSTISLRNTEEIL